MERGRIPVVVPRVEILRRQSKREKVEPVAGVNDIHHSSLCTQHPPSVSLDFDMLLFALYMVIRLCMCETE